MPPYSQYPRLGSYVFEGSLKFVPQLFPCISRPEMPPTIGIPDAGFTVIPLLNESLKEVFKGTGVIPASWILIWLPEKLKILLSLALRR